MGKFRVLETTFKNDKVRHKMHLSLVRFYKMRQETGLYMFGFTYIKFTLDRSFSIGSTEFLIGGIYFALSIHTHTRQRHTNSPHKNNLSQNRNRAKMDDLEAKARELFFEHISWLN